MGMSETSLLQPEVLPKTAHLRARRRHLFLAASAAAVGGAIGSGAVVLGALGLFHSHVDRAEAVESRSATPAIPPSIVEASPPPLIEVTTVPAKPINPARVTSILMADTARVVLDGDVIKSWLEPGDPRIIDSGDIHYVLEKGVNLSALPQELRALTAAPVTLFGKDGSTCNREPRIV